MLQRNKFVSKDVPFGELGPHNLWISIENTKTLKAREFGVHAIPKGS